MKTWSMEDGLLYFQERIYVPKEKEVRRAVMESRHDAPSAGHPGQFRTFELLSRKYYWPGMKKSVVKYIQACDSCIRSKHSNQAPAGLMLPIDIPSRPWEEITYDLIVGLPMSDGYDAVLTVVDRFSKMVHYIPTTSRATAVDVANLFVNFVWKLHGLPKKTISDRRPSFNAKFLRQVYKRLGIEPHFSTTYHPQVDGQSERANQFVEIFLRHYINHCQTDWVAFLPMAEFAYNNGVHSGSNQSPFYMCYGFYPQFAVGDKSTNQIPAADEHAEFIKKGLEEAKASLRVAQETHKRYYDRKRRVALTFKGGDKVWLDASNIQTDRPSKKLAHKRLGPYEILDKIRKTSYKLKLPKTMKVHPVFHVSLLYGHPTDEFGRRPTPPPPVVTPEGEEEYEVEKILNSRKVGRQLQYLICWKGYGPEEDTWQPKADVANAPELVQRFHQQHPEAPGP
jgi:transposase InsO family protein